jgi:hypothetical protein
MCAAVPSYRPETPVVKVAPPSCVGMNRLTETRQAQTAMGGRQRQAPDLPPVSRPRARRSLQLCNSLSKRPLLRKPEIMRVQPPGSQPTRTHAVSAEIWIPALHTRCRAPLTDARPMRTLCITKCLAFRNQHADGAYDGASGGSHGEVGVTHPRGFSPPERGRCSCRCGGWEGGLTDDRASGDTSSAVAHDRVVSSTAESMPGPLSPASRARRCRRNSGPRRSPACIFQM